MLRLAGGRFRMGSDRHYPEEAPVRDAEVGPFAIDVHPVTNRQFAAFVDATGYVTMAEREPDPALYPGVDPARLVPGALVFEKPRGQGAADDWTRWWVYRPHAHWRRPEAGKTVFAGRLDHPVTCVAYADARAYADWAGKALPTEAQWEYAARGGLDGAAFAWGEELAPNGQVMAHYWTGRFPQQAPKAGPGTRRVASYPANGYGLHDMIGNVWEWTSDWFIAGGTAATSCCAASAPAESFDPDLPGIAIPRRVVKGGSFLCAADYCARYRPAARQPQMIDTAAVHIGFRCVSAV